MQNDFSGLKIQFSIRYYIRQSLSQNSIYLDKNWKLQINLQHAYFDF